LQFVAILVLVFRGTTLDFLEFQGEQSIVVL
jgi:hypothetical protein